MTLQVYLSLVETYRSCAVYLSGPCPEKIGTSYELVAWVLDQANRFEPKVGDGWPATASLLLPHRAKAAHADAFVVTLGSVSALSKDLPLSSHLGARCRCQTSDH